MSTLNERIKKLRKALDLTQQEFADRLCIKRNTVATYERGKSDPSDAAVILICKTFNVSETWLRTGEGEMFIQQSRENELSSAVYRLLDGESSAFKTRLIKILADLGPREWDILEGYALKLVQDRPPTAEALTLETGLAEKVTLLERQNRELAERLEAIEKEDAETESLETAAQNPTPSRFR